MQLYFSQLWMAALSISVAAMSSLAQLWDLDTEKQTQHRGDDMRLDLQ